MSRFDKIILIDDDPIFSFITKAIIESSSVFKNNLLTYTNGQMALKDFKEKNLNQLKLLIFVDINMPIMDGWDFLDILSKSHLNESTEIYVVSSSINKDDEKKSLASSIVKGFISKPLEVDKLMDIASLQRDA